ncbi:DUF4394 domain-containing protein [Deinococcus altitudinis]|uniref:DUF4394 domain-containing protein n=1 Tax=Deinococcus altitudinis TaxID=468914 RepID=UPI003891C939
MRNALIFATLSLTLAACSQAVLPPIGTVAYGLNASGELVTFGMTNPSSSASNKTITGLTSGDTLVDLDINPANGSLYAFASSGRVYTIDASTGAAALNTTPIAPLATFKTDFNPAANRVRVFDSGTGNYRLTVEPAPTTSPKGTVTPDGALAYAVTDVNAGKAPKLLGAAYTSSYLNSGTAPTTTALYSVDAATNTLDLHTGGPAFSTLTTVGGLGLTLGSSVGFDVTTVGGTNTAYLVNDRTLYTVNLSSGVTTQIGTLNASITALAVSLSAP